MRGLRNAFDAWSESLKCRLRDWRRAWKLASLACGRVEEGQRRKRGREQEREVEGREEERAHLDRRLARPSRHGRDPELGERVELDVRWCHDPLHLGLVPLPLLLALPRRGAVLRALVVGALSLRVAVGGRLRGGAVDSWRRGRAAAFARRGGRAVRGRGGRGGEGDAGEGGGAARGCTLDAG